MSIQKAELIRKLLNGAAETKCAELATCLIDGARWVYDRYAEPGDEKIFPELEGGVCA